MSKDKMIKDMENKVNEVVNAKQAVYNFINSIEDTVAEGAEAVKQLEAVIETKKDALHLAVDMGEARLAKEEINKLAEELELQKMMNVSREKAMQAETEEIVDAFFAVYKVGTRMFEELDKYLLGNTTLVELADTKELMEGFQIKINGSLSGVVYTMTDAGFFAQRQVLYKGSHLNPTGLMTALRDLERDASKSLEKLETKVNSLERIN